jgi:acetyl esterase/lipase
MPARRSARCIRTVSDSSRSRVPVVRIVGGKPGAKSPKLTGLPPALFTVGHADHLLDDSLFMAARWKAWGNEVELAVYPDCIHGFLRFPMALAERARQRIHGFMDRCLGPA